MPSLAELMKGLTPRQNQYMARLVASLPYKYGGLDLPIENTAMQRARELGFQTGPSKELYHSARGDWGTDVVDPSLSDLGLHVGTLEQAENRAKAFATGGLDYPEGSNIIPLMANKYANMLPVKDVGSFHASGIAPQLEKKKLIAKGKAKQISDIVGQDWEKESQLDEQMRNALEQNDYHGIKYKNEQEGEGTSYAFTDPSMIRSRFAAFNPWRKEETNLLASHPIANAIGITGLAKLLSQGQDVDLRGSINDYLSEGYDPAGLERLTGVAPTTRKGDIALETLGALPGPIGAMATGASLVDVAENADWKKIKKSISNYFK